MMATPCVASGAALALAPDLRTSCSFLVLPLCLASVSLPSAAAAALWHSVSCGLRDLGAGLPSHGLYTFSQHSRTFKHTHTHTSRYIPALFPSTLCSAARHSHTRTNTNTLQCGPLSSPCFICQAINSPPLRNLSQTPHMPRLSSHNGALPAHMPLSITQKCHTAGVTRQIHHFNPFFPPLSLCCHYMSTERRMFLICKVTERKKKSAIVAEIAVS